MKPFKFLENRPHKVRYAYMQYLALASALEDTCGAIIKYTETRFPVEFKLAVVVLHNLHLRMDKKQVYVDQKNVSFTYRHEEAIAFMIVMAHPTIQSTCSDREKLAIQHTINELHKHYV
jgi:hypothetical protein